jgi:hypothetical protein
MQSEAGRGKKLRCRLAGTADKQPAPLDSSLSLLYLRNVNGFKWNHKRIYRIYRELELKPPDQAAPSSNAQETSAVSCDENDRPELVNGLDVLPACR